MKLVADESAERLLEADRRIVAKMTSRLERYEHALRRIRAAKTVYEAREIARVVYPIEKDDE